MKVNVRALYVQSPGRTSTTRAAFPEPCQMVTEAGVLGVTKTIWLAEFVPGVTMMDVDRRSRGGSSVTMALPLMPTPFASKRLANRAGRLTPVADRVAWNESRETERDDPERTVDETKSKGSSFELFYKQMRHTAFNKMDGDSNLSGTVRSKFEPSLSELLLTKQ